jgi:hypothetical protein
MQRQREAGTANWGDAGQCGEGTGQQVRGDAIRVRGSSARVRDSASQPATEVGRRRSWGRFGEGAGRQVRGGSGRVREGAWPAGSRGWSAAEALLLVVPRVIIVTGDRRFGNKSGSLSALQKCNISYGGLDTTAILSG